MEVKLENVSFSYQKEHYQKRNILENISFTLVEGTITGLIGKSGSGKTTLLELLDGLLLPNDGIIQVGEFVITSNTNRFHLDKIRSKVGLLFQYSEEQFFHKTVREELLFRLHLYHYHVEEATKRMQEAMNLVGLSETILEKNPFTLSCGEKRKVAIASVLIYNPKILLFDEPTTGLDSVSKKQFVKLCKILKNRYQKTILIASHDTDFLHMICDDVLILSNGKIVENGSKYEVFEKELKKYGVTSPQIISFSKKVLEKKNIRLGYRDDIKDLIKDIYRNVS